MNVRFCYRYRDYGNNKKSNEVVFLNQGNITLDEIRKKIIENLFDDKLFYSTEWKVPDLHFDDWDPKLDHFIHEFNSVSETYEKANMEFEIADFLEIIENAHNGWMLD